MRRRYWIVILLVLAMLLACDNLDGTGTSAGCANATCTGPTPTMPKW